MLILIVNVTFARKSLVHIEIETERNRHTENEPEDEDILFKRPFLLLL